MSETQEAPIQLKTAPILVKIAKTTLQRHGCLVEEGRVTLPLGSRRTPLDQSQQPITLWYELLLPDHYRMLEAYDQRRELSLLFWRPEGVPAERRNQD